MVTENVFGKNQSVASFVWVVKAQAGVTKCSEFTTSFCKRILIVALVAGALTTCPGCRRDGEKPNAEVAQNEESDKPSERREDQVQNDGDENHGTRLASGIPFFKQRQYEATSEIILDMSSESVASSGFGVVERNGFEEDFNTRISDWQSERVFTKAMENSYCNHPHSYFIDSDDEATVAAAGMWAEMLLETGADRQDPSRWASILRETIRQGEDHQGEKTNLLAVCVPRGSIRQDDGIQGELSDSRLTRIPRGSIGSTPQSRIRGVKDIEPLLKLITIVTSKDREEALIKAKLELDPRSHVITISVRTKAPRLSVNIANAYAKGIEAFANEENKKRCEEAVSQIHEEMKRQKDEDARLGERLHNFRTEYRLDRLEVLRTNLNQRICETTANVLDYERRVMVAREWLNMLEEQKDFGEQGELPTVVADLAANQGLLYKFNIEQETLKKDIESVGQKIAKAATDLKRLELRKKVSGEIYQLLLQKEEEVRFAAEKKNITVNVVRLAQMPSKPVGDRKNLYEAKSEFMYDAPFLQEDKGFGIDYKDVFNKRLPDWRSEAVLTRIVQVLRSDYPNSKVSDEELRKMFIESKLRLVPRSRHVTITVRSNESVYVGAFANTYANVIEMLADEERRKRHDKVISQVQGPVVQQEHINDELARKLRDFRTEHKPYCLEAQRAILVQSLSVMTANVLEYEKRVLEEQRLVKELEAKQKKSEKIGDSTKRVYAKAVAELAISQKLLGKFKQKQNALKEEMELTKQKIVTATAGLQRLEQEKRNSDEIYQNLLRKEAEANVNKRLESKSINCGRRAWIGSVRQL